MRGCVREGRDSRNYSVEREITKNRRERESFRMDGRFGRRMGRSENAEVHKTIRKGEEERECWISLTRKRRINQRP